MKNIVLSILVVFGTASCEPFSRPTNSHELAIPAELSDCKFFYMGDNAGNTYLVTRCPHSTTSTTSTGKHPRRTIVIDGVEYAEVKQGDK